MFFKSRSDCCNLKSLYYFSCWQQITGVFCKWVNIPGDLCPASDSYARSAQISKRSLWKTSGHLAPKPKWRNDQIPVKIQTKDVITIKDWELHWVQTRVEVWMACQCLLKLLTWLIGQVLSFLCLNHHWRMEGKLCCSCSLIWVRV